jgi:hypothetical protein
MKPNKIAVALVSNNHQQKRVGTAEVWVNEDQNCARFPHWKNVSVAAAAEASVMLFADIQVPVSPNERTRLPEYPVALRQYHHLDLGNLWLGQQALSVLHQGPARASPYS